MGRVVQKMNLEIVSTTPASDLPPNHVVVRFGAGIPSEAQGHAMLVMERTLREIGLPAEVFKDMMADDSKLRRHMTKEQRSKL